MILKYKEVILFISLLRILLVHYYIFIQIHQMSIVSSTVRRKAMSCDLESSHHALSMLIDGIGAAYRPF